MTKVELVERWFREVWENGNLDVVDEMLPEVFTMDNMGGGEQFKKHEFREMFHVFRGLIGIPRIKITHHVENGDWVSARVNVQADGADGQTPINFNGQMMIRFDGVVMAETFSNFDYLGLFEQLGQLPPDTLAVCMTGERFRRV